MKLMFRMLFLLPLFTVSVLRADEEAAQIAQLRANEQRLRDSLRAVTQQLRAAEADKAGAIAAAAERDERIALLEKQVAALTKRGNDDKAAADKTIGHLQGSLDAAKQEVTRLTVTLEKWKAGYQKLSGIAQKTESVRAKLDAENVALERRVAERERQNLELYSAGREILQRYADYSSGRAIAAKEPFTRIARARLEEQVQGYADRIEDNKIKPAPSDGKPSTAPSNPGPKKP